MKGIVDIIEEKAIYFDGDFGLLFIRLFFKWICLILKFGRVYPNKGITIYANPLFSKFFIKGKLKYQVKN